MHVLVERCVFLRYRQRRFPPLYLEAGQCRCKIKVTSLWASQSDLSLDTQSDCHDLESKDPSSAFTQLLANGAHVGSAPGLSLVEAEAGWWLCTMHLMRTEAVWASSSSSPAPAHYLHGLAKNLNRECCLLRSGGCCSRGTDGGGT